MSPRQPRLTAGDMVKIVQGWGFSFARQKGSHMQYKNSAGVRVTIPDHGPQILHPKILKTILKDAGKTVSDLTG
jgi:predicted RNA binding protein YcfA (HicA-like mRNA interferase family)